MLDKILLERHNDIALQSLFNVNNYYYICMSYTRLPLLRHQ